jgi:hypothetical protein
MMLLKVVFVAIGLTACYSADAVELSYEEYQLRPKNEGDALTSIDVILADAMAQRAGVVLNPFRHDREKNYFWCTAAGAKVAIATSLASIFIWCLNNALSECPAFVY